VLERNFGTEYQVWRIPHCSNYISQEDYRREVGTILNQQNQRNSVKFLDSSLMVSPSQVALGFDPAPCIHWSHEPAIVPILPTAASSPGFGSVGHIRRVLRRIPGVDWSYPGHFQKACGLVVRPA